jgi:hypothetical protein
MATGVPSGMFYEKVAGDAAMGPLGFVFGESAESAESNSKTATAAEAACSGRILVVKSMVKEGDEVAEGGDADLVTGLMKRIKARSAADASGMVLTEADHKEIRLWMDSKKVAQYD